MTTVEVAFRYAEPPTEQVAQALARVRDVYGIRQLRFDSGARTLRVEYDATRLNAAMVAKLVREAGLELVPDAGEGPPLIVAPTTEKPAPPAA